MADTGRTVHQELNVGASLLRRHGWRLLLVFVAVLLPLWGFGEIADEVREQAIIPFDEPVLRWAHAMGSDGFDRLFVWLSQAGYAYGVVPFDLLLVLVLTWRRHAREAVFATFALAGSALLNLAAKQLFARDRPSLWESIAPESNFSFPSGHAMGSATLACVLLALAWNTRWRWPALVLGLMFVAGVGLSRVYLGVHYPSDILAGWAASLAWVMVLYIAVFNGGERPWDNPSVPR